MVPSAYSQSTQYRLVEQRYARNNQTRTHIQLRIQFCLVHAGYKPALFSAVPNNNIIQIALPNSTYLIAQFTNKSLLGISNLQWPLFLLC